MNPDSSKALTWLSGGIIGLALLVMSPTGSFVALVMAALCAALPSLFGVRRTRILAVCFLVLSVALAVWLYPAFLRERAAYSQRARERATGTHPAPAQSEEIKK